MEINLDHIKKPFDHSGEESYAMMGWDTYDDEDLIRIYRVSKPDIKEVSIKEYIKNLRLFKKLYDKYRRKERGDVFIDDYFGGGIHNFGFITPNEEYNPKDLIKDLPITTQRNYFNAILPVIKSLYEYPNNWSERVDTMDQPQTEKYYGESIRLINQIGKSNAEKNIISDKKKEKFKATFQDVIGLIPKLKGEGLYQDALILSLMTEYKLNCYIKINKNR